MEDAMAEDPIVSAETVAAACDNLLGRGEEPSVRLVRSVLGGGADILKGSPNGVLKYLRQWRAARLVPEATSVRPEPMVAERTGSFDTLPEMESAMDGLRDALYAAMGRIQAAERHATEDRVNTLVSSHAEQLAAHDREHAKVKADLEEQLALANKELDEAMPSVSQAEELVVQVGDLETKAASMGDRIKTLEGELHGVKMDLAKAVEARDAALASAGRVEGEARAWREELTRTQSELSMARQEAKDTAEQARRILDGVRAEVSEAAVAGRVQAERVETLARDIERLRGERDVAHDKVAGLVERAAKAEAELALIHQPRAAAA
jgi:DNA repair exonuclease SbcCD ATPase subunit